MLATICTKKLMSLWRREEMIHLGLTNKRPDEQLTGSVLCHLADLLVGTEPGAVSHGPVSL